MLPDKTSRCHRTGFTETCFKCVTEHGCKLWKRVTLLDRHPETGAEIAVDSYDCLDSQQELFWKDMLRRQLQTTATVDKVAATVEKANDQQMVGAIARLNRQMDEAQHQIANGSDPRPLMIEQD
jgi:hypothetical protein